MSVPVPFPVDAPNGDDDDDVLSRQLPQSSIIPKPVFGTQPDLANRSLPNSESIGISRGSQWSSGDPHPRAEDDRSTCASEDPHVLETAADQSIAAHTHTQKESKHKVKMLKRYKRKPKRKSNHPIAARSATITVPLLNCANETDVDVNNDCGSSLNAEDINTADSAQNGRTTTADSVSRATETPLLTPINREVFDKGRLLHTQDDGDGDQSHRDKLSSLHDNHSDRSNTVDIVGSDCRAEIVQVDILNSTRTQLHPAESNISPKADSLPNCRSNRTEAVNQPVHRSHPCWSNAPLNDKTLAKKFVQMELDIGSKLYLPAKALCTSLFRVTTRIVKALHSWCSEATNVDDDLLLWSLPQYMNHLLSFSQAQEPDGIGEHLIVDKYREQPFCDLAMFSTVMAEQAPLDRSEPAHLRELALTCALLTFSDGVSFARLMRHDIVAGGRTSNADGESRSAFIREDTVLCRNDADLQRLSSGSDAFLAYLCRKHLAQFSVFFAEHFPHSVQDIVEVISELNELDLVNTSPAAVRQRLHQAACQRSPPLPVHKKRLKRKSKGALRQLVQKQYTSINNGIRMDHAILELKTTLEVYNSLEFWKSFCTVHERDINRDFDNFVLMLIGSDDIDEVLQSTLPCALRRALLGPDGEYSKFTDNFDRLYSDAVFAVSHTYSYYLLRVQLLFIFVTTDDASSSIMPTEIQLSVEIVNAGIKAVMDVMHLAMIMTNFEYYFDLFMKAVDMVFGPNIDQTLLSATKEKLSEQLTTVVPAPDTVERVKLKIMNGVESILSHHLISGLVLLGNHTEYPFSRPTLNT